MFTYVCGTKKIVCSGAEAFTVWKKNPAWDFPSFAEGFYFGYMRGLDRAKKIHREVYHGTQQKRGRTAKASRR
jgi:hypothetical protein